MGSRTIRARMELRHLKCFLAVAEELHFTRAAERLHIEQSPLSRAIRELEEDLGTKLFLRTTRSTQLTRAGQLFLEHVRRIFAAVEQARECVRAVANGFHGQLRVVLSDCSTRSHLPALLAQWRQEEPEIEVRLFEAPLSQQIQGLQDDLYDVGLSLSNEVGEGLIAHRLWSEPLVVALPPRHPLLAYKRIPLEALADCPLVLCDPEACEGHARLVDQLLQRLDRKPTIVDRVSSFDLMMTLVSAGLALGLAGASHVAASRESGVIARLLAEHTPMATTYLLHTAVKPAPTLARFVELARAIDPLPCSERDHSADHHVPEDVES